MANIVVTLTLGNDTDCECPIGESGDSRERIVSFNKRHVNYADPDEFFDWTPQGPVPKIGLRRQLDTGCAVLLDYYEHGQCRWSLSGHGPQCRWDTSRGAGVYWLPTDVPKDRREEYAMAALAEYTDWCNGACYGFVIVADTAGVEEDVDSCWGFIGDDHMLKDHVAPALQAFFDGHKEDEVELVIDGEAKCIADYTALPRPATALATAL